VCVCVCVFRLGGGLFGDTYLGEWKSRNVAAKRITVGIHLTQTGASELEWIVDTVSLLRLVWQALAVRNSAMFY